MSMKVYLFVVLICITLIISNIKRLFIDFWLFLSISLKKYLSVIFQNKVVFCCYCGGLGVLYIFGWQSDIQFKNIYFHSVGCFFTLLILFFAQKFWTLIKFSVSISSSIVLYKESLSRPMSWSFFLTFSFKTFIVVALECRSLVCLNAFLYIVLSRIQLHTFACWYAIFSCTICSKVHSLNFTMNFSISVKMSLGFW